MIPLYKNKCDIENYNNYKGYQATTSHYESFGEGSRYEDEEKYICFRELIWILEDLWPY